MQKMVFSFMLFFSTLSWANSLEQNPKTCFSHGECQRQYPIVKGSRCFLVKTGYDNSGARTCAIRCYHLPLAAYCHSLSGEHFGVCKRESFERPSFNPEKPDCSGAVDMLTDN